MPEAARVSDLLQAHRGEDDEPGLRRDEAFQLWAERARIEVVDDVQPGRIVDQPRMRLTKALLDGLRIGRDLHRLQRRLKCIVLPLLEVEAVRRETCRRGKRSAEIRERGGGSGG